MPVGLNSLWRSASNNYPARCDLVMRSQLQGIVIHHVLDLIRVVRGQPHQRRYSKEIDSPHRIADSFKLQQAVFKLSYDPVGARYCADLSCSRICQSQSGANSESRSNNNPPTAWCPTSNARTAHNQFGACQVRYTTLRPTRL